MKQNKEAIYLHPTDFKKLICHLIKESDETFIINPQFVINGIRIYSEEILSPGAFFICEPGLFELYKQIKLHPWVDKSYTDDQLQKIATGLWEAEKKRIKPTFTEGEMFPTGAMFKADSIEYLRSEIDLKFRF